MTPHLPPLLLFATTPKRLLIPAIYFQDVQLHHHSRSFRSSVVHRIGRQSVRRLLLLPAKHCDWAIVSTRLANLKCPLLGMFF
jgi:hypothetical protein